MNDPGAADIKQVNKPELLFIEEHKFRLSLYGYSKLVVAYNPVDSLPDPVDIIDLTFDAANRSKINHLNTREVRQALGQAKMVVCDSPTLLNIVKDAGPKKITHIPYGHLEAKRVRKVSDDVTFGILNHNDVHLAANSFGRKILNSLKKDLIIYGQAGKLNLSVDCREIDSLIEFCSLVDVVVIVAHPNSLVSPTLPIALQCAGLGILASSTNSLQILLRSQGAVLIRENSEKAFKDGLKQINAKTAIAALQQGAIDFAGKTNRQGKETVQKIEKHLLS
jgi:hypothetical protein